MKTVPPIAACAAMRAHAAAPQLPAWRRAGLSEALRLLFRRRRRVLDMRTLPDHLKRDIGALDGNDPKNPRP